MIIGAAFTKSVLDIGDCDSCDGFLYFALILHY